jgi:uncharacterized membrane protein
MTLLRAALAGAASGGRTFTGLAALTLAAPAKASTQPDATLRHPAAKLISCGLALQEWVGDTLPEAPSRLAPLPVTGRILAGAMCAAIIVRRAAPHRELAAGDFLAPVTVGAAAALIASWLGVRWRAWAAPRLGRDLVGAVIEDGWVLTLAASAARSATP